MPFMLAIYGGWPFMVPLTQFALLLPEPLVAVANQSITKCTGIEHLSLMGLFCLLGIKKAPNNAVRSQHWITPNVILIGTQSDQ